MRNVLIATIVLGFLAGCGGPPPPPPTLVGVTLSADPRSNDGAPLSVRVYQLASPAAFEAAQFFPLYNGDAVLLKDDLIKRDDVLLAPGQSKTLSLTPTDKTKVIGIVGAYRNYETLTWRTLTPVPAHESSVLTVVSSVAGLAATIAPAK